MSGRSTWMKDNISLIGGRTLLQMCIPASHDSGMYEINYFTSGGSSGNTQTQTLDVTGQLNAGVRCFDIRPVKWVSGDGMQTEYFAGHFTNVDSVLGYQGCWGALIDDMLAQVASFVSTGNELVILMFSHFLDMANPNDTASVQSDIAEKVTTALGEYLFQASSESQNLLLLSFNDLIGVNKRSAGGTVLALFQSLDQSVKSDNPSIFGYSESTSDPIRNIVGYDSYTGTPDLQTMVADQTDKMLDSKNYGGNYYQVSWTLTQDAQQAALTSAMPTGIAILASCALAVSVPPLAPLAAILAGIFAAEAIATPSVLQLAAQAKAVLSQSMEKFILENGAITYFPNVIWVDACDGQETDVALLFNQSYGDSPAATSTAANNNYIPQGGDGGTYTVYMSLNPAVIPQGSTFKGLNFAQVGNQVVCEVTVVDASGNRSVITPDTDHANYIHDGNSSGMENFYVCLNPILFPLGAEIQKIGFQLTDKSNQFCLSAYVNDNGNSYWVQANTNDNYYPSPGSSGGIKNNYVDTNAVTLIAGQQLAGLALWINGNQIVPALIARPD